MPEIKPQWKGPRLQCDPDCPQRSSPSHKERHTHVCNLMPGVLDPMWCWPGVSKLQTDLDTEQNKNRHIKSELIHAVAEAARAVCGLDTPKAEQVRTLVYSCMRLYDAVQKNYQEEPAAAVRQRNDLLARIHGDGGDYLTEHGLDKALEDAHKKVGDCFAGLESTRVENEKLKKALEFYAYFDGLNASIGERARAALKKEGE